MELKVEKRIAAECDVVERDGYLFVMGEACKIKKSTAKAWECTNVTTANVECIQLGAGVDRNWDVDGITVKSRYLRGFVGLGNPEWRG